MIGTQQIVVVSKIEIKTIGGKTMFCEKCGTRVDDGQPFCPNCGNRMSESPAETPTAAASARPAKAVSSADGLLGKLNAMQGLEKIFYPIVGGLLILSFLLSLLKVFTDGVETSLFSYESSCFFSYGSSFFATVVTVLFTLCITFYVLDYFDQFTFK